MPVRSLALKPQHCRWPVDGEAGMLGAYCGQRTLDGCSYCADHARIAHGRAETGAAALDAQHVELPLNVTEYEIRSGHVRPAAEL